jgi:hypothetical protein
MSLRHIALGSPTNKRERLGQSAARRETAAARGRVANTDLRMLVGHSIVCAVPHGM